MQDAEDSEIEEVAIHASSVRNAFFDDQKRMSNVIPPVLLVTVGERTEISPRRWEKVPKAAAWAQSMKRTGRRVLRAAAARQSRRGRRR